jgi:4-hydroxythreonine-4-phosphate dehydrogenase
MSEFKPLIAITMGDPAGIGPEVAVKVLNLAEIHKACRPLVIGQITVIKQAAEMIGSNLKIRKILSANQGIYQTGIVNVLEAGRPPADMYSMGIVSAAAGQAAFASVKVAIDLAKNDKIAAVVTGPIHKESLNLAGHLFSGHTEIFAHFTGTKKYAMLLVHGNLRVIHVSTHVSLRQACDLVKKERIIDVINFINEACGQFGISSPRIGVAGLNPHAGDGGLFGDEEKNEIEPAVKTAKRAGIDVEGPVPADTLFPKARGGKYDGCVAMYHDQGHIPFKYDGFVWDERSGAMKSAGGVNITLGLPLIRTSVDHGTAFDIAGKGIASPEALKLAINYAILMIKNRAKK